jgi:2-dehydro-3-deoxyphosphogluconate aldolase/(4S)-4-hydroxy-2-oxoglutarate aldolase
VIECCRELDVLVIPGVATATEVIAALDQGLDLLKLWTSCFRGASTRA